MRFVRGRFNVAPYWLLSAPLSEGGLDCPSLVLRRQAYDAKFFSDLISGPTDVPWKLWTMADLTHASSHMRSRARDSGVPLNPLVQHAHVCLKLLEPRVRQGFLSMRTLRYNMSRCFPSRNARHSMPVAFHPAVCSKLSKEPAVLYERGITTVLRLARPGSRLSGIKDLKVRRKLLKKARNLRDALNETQWSDSARFWSSAQVLGDGLRIWPKMKGALGCASILGKKPSLLVARTGISSFAAPAASAPHRLLKKLRAAPVNPRHARMGIFSLPVCPPRPRQARQSRVPGAIRDITVWTDGSAIDNGEDRCVAGASWFSSEGSYAYARITGVIPSNNVAETAAVIMALRSWYTHVLHIVTDSKFVLGLVNGGLLAMERDGWPDTPLSNYRRPASLKPMFKYLLYLLRRHNASLRFSWVKGHSGVEENEIADGLARSGVESDLHELDVSSLFTLMGWVDDTPVLNFQSLSHLTYAIVRDQTPNPIMGPKFESFRMEWAVWMQGVFSQDVDILRVYESLWTINIPKGLRELLWRSSSGSLPIGHQWHGRSPLGRDCHCGHEFTLGHVWEGCGSYHMWPLREILLDSMSAVDGGNHRTLLVASWPSPYWFPLLCLKQLEKSLNISRKEQRSLRNTRARREWILGSYLWSVWKWRIKEVMDEHFTFIPSAFTGFLRTELGVG